MQTKAQKKTSSEGWQIVLLQNQGGNENRERLNSVGVWKYYLLSEGNKNSVPSSHHWGEALGAGRGGWGLQGLPCNSRTAGQGRQHYPRHHWCSSSPWWPQSEDSPDTTSRLHPHWCRLFGYWTEGQWAWALGPPVVYYCESKRDVRFVIRQIFFFPLILYTLHGEFVPPQNGGGGGRIIKTEVTATLHW